MRITIVLFITLVLAYEVRSAPGTGCYASSADGKCTGCFGPVSEDGTCTLFDLSKIGSSGPTLCGDSKYVATATPYKGICNACWGNTKPDAGSSSGCIAVTTPVEGCAVHKEEGKCSICSMGWAVKPDYKCLKLEDSKIISDCLVPLVDTSGVVTCKFCARDFHNGDDTKTTCVKGRVPCMFGKDIAEKNCPYCDVFQGYYTTGNLASDTTKNICGETYSDLETIFKWKPAKSTKSAPIMIAFAMMAGIFSIFLS